MAVIERNLVALKEVNPSKETTKDRIPEYLIVSPDQARGLGALIRNQYKEQNLYFCVRPFTFPERMRRLKENPLKELRYAIKFGIRMLQSIRA